MILSLSLLVLATSLLVRADPTPSAPGPGDTFKVGGTCHIAWEADTTGVWKVMNIELMTGSNFDMVHLTTVTTVDGTNPATTTFDYPCPAVTPNSAIYFYQFSSPASQTKYWTTRFTITDAQGGSTPPSQQTQPGTNAPIPWGTGALVNPADAKPPPAGGGASGNSSIPSASTSPAVVTPNLPTSTVAPSTSFSTIVSSSTEQSSTSLPSATAAAGNVQNGAAGLTVDGRVYTAGLLFLAAGGIFGGLL